MTSLQGEQRRNTKADVYAVSEASERLGRKNDRNCNRDFNRARPNSLRGRIEREGNKMMRMNREEETQKWTQKERRETEDPGRHIQETKRVVVEKAGTQTQVSIELIKYGILSCEILSGVSKLISLTFFDMFKLCRRE